MTFAEIAEPGLLAVVRQALERLVAIRAVSGLTEHEIDLYQQLGHLERELLRDLHERASSGSGGPLPHSPSPRDAHLRTARHAR